MKTAGDSGSSQERRRKKGFSLGVDMKIFLTFAVGITILLLLNKDKQHLKLPSPSITVESMSMTVLGVASDYKEVKANLEVEFAVAENNADDGPDTIFIKRFLVLDFDGGNKLGSVPSWNVTAPSISQRGGERSTVRFRKDGVAVNVDEYEHHMLTTYGVFNFELEMKGELETVNHHGRWVIVARKYFTAECGQVRVVLPLYPWVRAQRIDFQPSKTCEVF